MCDLHRRLAAAVAKLAGVRKVDIKPRGDGFTRHPHLAIELHGCIVREPLRGRPTDKSRRYFLNYLHTIRRRIDAARATPQTRAST